MTDTPSPTRKPVFDAVRRLLGRGSRPAEVDALDQALDPVLLPEGDTFGAKGDTFCTKADTSGTKDDTRGAVRGQEVLECRLSGLSGISRY